MLGIKRGQKVVELMRGFGVDKWFNVDNGQISGHVHIVTKFYPEGGDAYKSICSQKLDELTKFYQKAKLGSLRPTPVIPPTLKQ